jgi:RNA polymerase sigma factor (sigma-70 family)
MIEAAEIVNRVKAARAGEQAAWNALYQYYYPRLLNTAFYYCGNSPETKDLVQDSFITAFLKLNQLKDAAVFGAWIQKILVHKCFRVKKKAQDDFVDIVDESWQQHQEEAEKHLRLQSAITTLPQVLRTTLLLRYFSGRQSYDEIAGILSIPVGTVRSRLNEAKAKLSAAWSKPVANASKLVQEQESWNEFYRETLTGLHHNAEQRRIYLDHLQQHTQVVAPDKQLINKGRDFFEGMISSDQACGSWLKPVNIISSGNVSIIEQKHFNSPEHPHHCPPACVVILYRKQEKAERVHIYASGQ